MRSLRFLWPLALLAGLCPLVRAEVAITVLAGQFTDATGTTPLANGSLVVLVADTQKNGFGGLVPGSLNVGSFLNGADDQVLFRTFVNTGLGSSSISDTLSHAALSGGWDANDPLALYWFPGLDATSFSFTTGQNYGFFTTGTPGPLSDAWVTPSDGSSISLRFLTPSAGGDGTYANADGAARFTVTAIPEPATSATVAAGAMLAWAVLRRRRVRV